MKTKEELLDKATDNYVECMIILAGVDAMTLGGLMPITVPLRLIFAGKVVKADKEAAEEHMANFMNRYGYKMNKDA